MTERQRIALAEAVGTAVLVIGGPGTAVLAGGGVGTLGVAIAFGLSLLCMAYVIGPVSGCHINPAVTVGMWLCGKTKREDVPWYVGAQVVGGIVGAFVVFVIANGVDGFSAEFTGFASNGWGDHSPGGYNFAAMLVTEVVLTALFVFTVLGTTRVGFPVGFGGLAAGLMLTLVHLVSIPVDNTSVNPARSIATALFQTDWALKQLWAFIVFPLIGGALGAGIWIGLGDRGRRVGVG
jgi:aquaporin Z